MLGHPHIAFRVPGGDLSMANNFTESADLRAAGGIVWSGDDTSDRRIAIVHRGKRDDWALPKGKPEADESPDQTALREAMEETGCNLRLGVFAGSYSYFVKDRRKVVDMWHMVRVPGSYPHRASEAEIDQVLWLTPLAAIQRLTHQVERDFVAAHIGETD